MGATVARRDLSRLGNVVIGARFTPASRPGQRQSGDPSLGLVFMSLVCSGLGAYHGQVRCSSIGGGWGLCEDGFRELSAPLLRPLFFPRASLLLRHHPLRRAPVEARPSIWIRQPPDFGYRRGVRSLSVEPGLV